MEQSNHRLIIYHEDMAKIYQIKNNDFILTFHVGLYAKVIYLQGSSPTTQLSYETATINSIYLSSTLEKREESPRTILKTVKEFQAHNHNVSPKVVHSILIGTFPCNKP